jgi:signal transduction histidine kinase/CheY-like chemotaxis protein
MKTVEHYADFDRDSAHSKLVEEYFVKLFLQQNKRAQVGIVLSALMVGVLLDSRIGPLPTVIWFGVVSLVSTVRFALTESLVRSVKSPLFVISALLAVNGLCLVWPLSAFNNLSDLDRAFVSIVLLALATASVATTSGYKGVFLWFAAPLLLSLASVWVFVDGSGEGPQTYLGLGGLIAIYLLFLVGFGRDAFRVFDESCRIRFAEQNLNTRLTQALEIAEQASNAKTRFLAAASHDLRQPLHTIGVLVSALSLRKLDSRSQEIAQLLDKVSRSLSAQLDGLLDVSKLDAGIVKPELKVESIDEIVGLHVTTVRAAAQEKGLLVGWHCERGVRSLTDANLMQRILGNLTANALKFTASGGLDIVVKRDGAYAVIEISDTGAGVAPEHMQLIFQEFFQVANAERDRSKGLGLGLAIVQRLCGLLGIELTLSSVLGQGSKFTLRLPTIDEVYDGSAQTVSAPLISIGDICVLVVDDEVEVRESMRLLLEELGCRVLLADGVRQANLHAAASAVDVVISDFRLKDDINGLEVIRQIQAVKPDVHALLISGDTAPDRLRQADCAGVTLLHKPVMFDELTQHLCKVKRAFS